MFQSGEGSPPGLRAGGSFVNGRRRHGPAAVDQRSAPGGLSAVAFEHETEEETPAAQEPGGAPGAGGDGPRASGEGERPEGAADAPAGGEEAAEAGAQGEPSVTELKARLAEEQAAREAAQREREELYDRLLRLQAEFDNYRKRTRRELEES